MTTNVDIHIFKVTALNEIVRTIHCRIQSHKMQCVLPTITYDTANVAGRRLAMAESSRLTHYMSLMTISGLHVVIGSERCNIPHRRKEAYVSLNCISS